MIKMKHTVQVTSKGISAGWVYIGKAPYFLVLVANPNRFCYLSQLILFLLPIFDDFLATKIGLDEINSEKWLGLVTNTKKYGDLPLYIQPVEVP
jgi:hypothetical protein